MHFGVGRVIKLHRHESVRTDLVAELCRTLDGAAHALRTRSQDDLGASAVAVHALVFAILFALLRSVFPRFY
jgi:hypothetical protein